MLAALGLMPDAAPSLPAAFPGVEREFKILWADHGDAVSEQYAGARGCGRRALASSSSVACARGWPG
jgi:hypothetical protein